MIEILFILSRGGCRKTRQNISPKNYMQLNLSYLEKIFCNIFLDKLFNHSICDKHIFWIGQKFWKSTNLLFRLSSLLDLDDAPGNIIFVSKIDTLFYKSSVTTAQEPPQKVWR